MNHDYRFTVFMECARHACAFEGGSHVAVIQRRARNYRLLVVGFESRNVFRNSSVEARCPTRSLFFVIPAKAGIS
jgi:hypothetical protein